MDELDELTNRGGIVVLIATRIDPKTRRLTANDSATTARLGSQSNAPQRTFRRQTLESAFQEFCQLSTDNPFATLSPAEFELLQQRAAEFIDSSEFASPLAERNILQDEFLSKCELSTSAAGGKRVSLPPYLASLCEEPLLTAQQERSLFQRMNFLRYRAHRILIKHQIASTLVQWEVERVQGLLRAADWYRDNIVKANVRLVISIVKKFANPQCSFDDLLSDGIMSLMRAVDKFDYQLGFRFSTYATQIVRRNTYRVVMDRQEERFRVANSLSEQGLEIAEELEPSSMSEQRWHMLRGHMRELLDKLDRREKFIIRARFSLGSHRRVQTLQKLADRLQISKERVRQLEKRALEKLTAMAVQRPPATV
ncbi:MAG: sigma-70 family RNA polymerase sigma factor [Aureliella sp.]